MSTVADFRYDVRPPVGAEAARLAAGVGRLLAEERVAAGLTKADLAARATVGAGTVSAIEAGRRRPAWSTLCKLANALHAGDGVAARGLAWRLADAAGASLAGDPRLPVSVTRELVVEVLHRSAVVLSLDVDDDIVRGVVADQLRLATGEAAQDSPVRAVVMPAVEGPQRVRSP